MKELATALAKAQGQIKAALKDSVNGGFRSKYADLTSIWDACREALTKNGLSVIQRTDFEGSAIWLETMLLHTSGEHVCSRYPLRPVKEDPQGYGSAMTYARRYCLAAMVGVVADEDDDGNAASQRHGSGSNSAPPPDRNAAARGWVSDAIRALGQLATADELDAWLAENAAKLTRLKAAYPEGYDAINGAMSESRKVVTARRSAAE